ncbi:hypothetical protein [Metallosphaera sp.]|uniref:hypothetical protein n=1 Tax=Metallosphaera sp. TaxID=2020860 RepID=UPI003166F126
MCIRDLTIKDGEAYATCDDEKKRIIMCAFEKYKEILNEARKKRDKMEKYNATDEEKKALAECFANHPDREYYVTVPSLLLRDNDDMCFYSFAEPLALGNAECKFVKVGYPVLEGDFNVENDTYILAGELGVLDFLSRTRCNKCNPKFDDKCKEAGYLVLPIATLLFYESFGTTLLPKFSIRKVIINGQEEKFRDFAVEKVEDAIEKLGVHNENLDYALTKISNASFVKSFIISVTPSV